MIDCGAGGEFINYAFVRKNKLNQEKLEKPLEVRNVDGTLNKLGTITHAVTLKIKIDTRVLDQKFYVTSINHDLILGLPWLIKQNPLINWREGILMWDWERILPEILNEEKEIDPLVISFIQGEMTEEAEEIWINSIMPKSATFNQEKIEETKKLEEQIPKEYHEFLSVFSEQAASRTPTRKPWDHKIELKEGFEPKSFSIYNLTQVEEEGTKEFIKENLEKGYIRESKSPMASPFFFVPKKDGKRRPCQDYRYLNNWTVKNAYPLLLISDIMDQIKDKKYFTKMDVRWGYNNVRIHEGDEWKAAFKTKFRLFEPLVMFFGLCNSPAMFQNMMDNIFVIELDKGIVIIYMDDILIPADTLEELEEITKIVLQRLKDNDLYLKPEKCEFARLRIEYLGMIIEQGKLKMDPKKVNGIIDWPEPKNTTQLRSFLGFGNFYRRFIRKYSDVVKPLNDLLKKDTVFQWNPEAQGAFDKLKKRFTEQPVLMMPDMTRAFQIESDASKFAYGAVITQTDSNGARHPVAFLSKTFTPTERRYEIYDRELMGIVKSLEEWRHYIQGSPFTTTVLSDHRNLTYFRKPQRLNDRQARWSLILSEYDINLVHTPGNKMIQSDALSRRPDHSPEDDENDEPAILLPEEMFINLIDVELQERINDCQSYDIDVTKALEVLKESNLQQLTSDIQEWTIEEKDGQKITLFKGKQYIPNDVQIRRDIVKKFHDQPSAGHPGELETYNQTREVYWWPGMRNFIKNYVKGCAQCQQFKIRRNPTKVPLMPIQGPKTTEPFKQISMDFITDLPETDGFDSILSVVDHGLLKGVILIPTMKTIDAKGTAKLLLDNLHKRFGLPDSVISDRGPQFAAKSIRELLKLLKVESRLSTAYHPQSDGTTERFNQEIEAYLSIYCLTNPKTWKDKLPTLEFAHNSRRHSDRQRTSFELMMGYTPRGIPMTF
jgi:hypothetical protein